jgi:hypothetical protein
MAHFAQKKFYNLQNFKPQIGLFLTGMIQVFFVAVNTYFLAQTLYIGVLVSSFMISMIWSFNVKRVAFGSLSDRILYALGASVGSITGLLAAQTFHTA